MGYKHLNTEQEQQQIPITPRSAYTFVPTNQPHPDFAFLLDNLQELDLV